MASDELPDLITVRQTLTVADTVIGTTLEFREDMNGPALYVVKVVSEPYTMPIGDDTDFTDKMFLDSDYVDSGQWYDVHPSMLGYEDGVTLWVVDIETVPDPTDGCGHCGDE